MRRVVLAFLAWGAVFAADSRGIEADFVAGPKIDAWQGPIKRGGDSACGGEVVTATVLRMPDADYMAGDEIQELDAEGRVLRTWRVPYESTPLGIDGDWLIVALTRSKGAPTVSVNTHGRMRSAPTPPVLPDSAHAQCPADAALPPSGYRWCMAMPDRAAPNHTRLVAYEGPCT